MVTLAGGALQQRRRQETQESKRRLGIQAYDALRITVASCFPRWKTAARQYDRSAPGAPAWSSPTAQTNTTPTSLLTRSCQVAFRRNAPRRKQDWGQGPEHHPRRRRGAVSARVCGDIIRAGGALRGVGDFVYRMGWRLSCRGAALEFVAEVLKVFPADLQLQHFFDHQCEVGQPADRSQGSCAGGPYEPPCRGPNERVLNRFERHAALVQLGREHSVRTAHRARSPWRRPIRFQQAAHVIALIDQSTIHGFSLVARAARDRRWPPCGSNAARGSAARPPSTYCRESCATRHRLQSILRCTA